MSEPGSTDPPEISDELRAYFHTEEGKRELARAFDRDIRAEQPRLWEALYQDALVYSSLLMGPPRFSTWLGFFPEALRLVFASDAFFCMALYRVRMRLRVWRVPILPRILHRFCMMLAQICIGDHVIIAPGVYLPHGQVVIDGAVRIGRGSVIAPWVTLGRNGAALEGPSLSDHVFVGTGAKILGPLKIGSHAVVGANAVVLKDVAPYTTVAGVPAKMIADRRDNPEFQMLREAVLAKKRELESKKV